MFRIRLQREHSSWQGPAAVACFALAIIAALAGSFLTTNAILNAHEHQTLYAIGLTSLILALPIAILGAHFLDLMDPEQKRSDA